MINLGDITMVIASVSGWDGVRILGAFESEELAYKLCSEAGFDITHENFNIDIVQMNKVSTYTQLVIDGAKKAGAFVKIHNYGEVGKPSKQY